MMAMRPKRGKVKPKDEAVQFVTWGKDKNGFDVKFINSFKGRGVFSTCHFQKGAFLMEYRGDVINKQEYERRLKIYHDALKVFMFEFRHNGKLLCIDAAREDGSLGRFVNDDHMSPNGKMRTITVNGKPHLCLFAIKDIQPGEEITYNYGNFAWPWRVMSHSHPTHDDEPATSLLSTQDIQAMSHSHPTHDDEPATSLLSTQDIQAMSHSHPTHDDEPATSLLSTQDIQAMSHSHPTHDDEPATSLLSTQDIQAMSHSHPTHDDEPATSLLSTQDIQVMSHSHPTHDDEPATSLLSTQDIQAMSHSHPTHDDEPATSLLSTQDIQVMSHSHPTHDDEPATSLLSTQDIQAMSHSHPTHDDEPATSLLSTQDIQAMSHSHPTHDDEPATSLLSTQDIQAMSHSHPTHDDEPATSLLSTQDIQVMSHSHPTHDDEPATSLLSTQDIQAMSHSHPTHDDEPATSLLSTQDIQVTSHSHPTHDDEPATSLLSTQDIQVMSHSHPTHDDEPATSLLSTQDIQTCIHVVCPSSMTGMDKCAKCLGPYSARKWDGVKCKVCSSIWHKICFNRTRRDDLTSPLLGFEESSSDEMSEEEYVPDSASSSDDSVKLTAKKLPQNKKSEVQKDEGASITTVKGSEDVQSIQSSTISSSAEKNYCFICGKPQSKLARHLEIHAKTHVEVAQALALPKNSKLRKKKLNHMRNMGNCTHNTEVYRGGSGMLKLKRKPKKKYDKDQYVHCMYCQGLYLRKHFWRHARNCKSKPQQDEDKMSGRALTLSSMLDSSLCQQISQGIWNLLTVMRDDEVSAVVRSDYNILQLAQSLFNKHGQDPTKHEYIRQKIREVGRLLLILRKEFSIYTLEEAVRPSNFHVLIQAVKNVSGFEEDKNSFKIPSLALKLGHSLQKICDIIYCKALVTGDDKLKKSTQTFKKLCSSKWSELISHTALTTLSDKHFNKPSTLPFTEDVQRLHKYLEQMGNSATENLKSNQSPQAYGELCKTTLTKIVLFNRRRGGEVSRMYLSAFLERDTTTLHKDVAVGLTKFEQKLCAHFSRVEIKGKRGRKVAVLLSPDMVKAVTNFISRRQECGVPKDNPFLFARPNCLTPFRAQDCLRHYASQCGAQNPELLRSTQLRKHIATISQVLNLKNHELDQVADFLGHDIRVHREYYRLPEATTQLAKISKLLLAMEKGTLSILQGKTLEEIEVEDKLDLTDTDESAESEADSCQSSALLKMSEFSTNQEPNEPPDPIDDDESAGEGTSQGKKRTAPPSENGSDSSDDVDSAEEGPSQAFPENKGRKKYPRKSQKRFWSPDEVAAVMRHFRRHIDTGKRATFIEIEHCKKAEHPALQERSLQNIRDFVRNRGVTQKKNKKSK